MLNKDAQFSIRPYEEKDFPEIHRLNQEEGWANLAANQQDTKAAWNRSAIAYVAERNRRVMACVRGLTDGHISLYICELLVESRERGQGIGKALLKYVHLLYPKTRMELLASATSHTFYEKHGFRNFYGFRKTAEE